MPRIRTIKPEFWSHPVLGRAPDEVRTGAIGLLNYADDEGYFLADAAAVRSFIWPFDDDSSKARRVLANLSRIGYIEVVEHPDHGPIGKIVSFEKHQRVDRANSSKLKGYFHSTNDRRTIDDQSLLEQGTGNREQGKEKTSVGLAPDVGAGTAKIAKTVELRAEAGRIIAFLNESAGKRFDLNGANADHVVARLRDGETADDCRAVITAKCREWKGDARMAKFLRPETLFSRTKFATYKGELGTRGDPSGRPTRTCSDCGKTATSWTGDRCDPCWRRYMDVDRGSGKTREAAA